jgi:hypothetical protein
MRRGRSSHLVCCFRRSGALGYRFWNTFGNAIEVHLMTLFLGRFDERFSKKVRDDRQRLFFFLFFLLLLFLFSPPRWGLLSGAKLVVFWRWCKEA